MFGFRNIESSSLKTVSFAYPFLPHQPQTLSKQPHQPNLYSELARLQLASTTLSLLLLHIALSIDHSETPSSSSFQITCTTLCVDTLESKHLRLQHQLIFESERFIEYYRPQLVKMEPPAANRHRPSNQPTIRMRPTLPKNEINEYFVSSTSVDENQLSEAKEDEDREEEFELEENVDGDEDESTEKSKKPKPIAKNPRHIVEGCNYNLKPLSLIAEIFDDLTENAMNKGLRDLLSHLRGYTLKVGTLCSGTESPILALREVCKALARRDRYLSFEHMFSAENNAFKQAYIQANFYPPILYRDITEFGGEPSVPAEGPLYGTTAFGTRVKTPGGLDILVAGTSCRDFSILNSSRKKVEANGQSGQTFFATLTYMEVERPKIVVFENVNTAPWLEEKRTPAQIANNQHALDFYIEEKGYATRLVKTDSRDYYMPHTRQRGYMICIEKRQAYLSLCPDANTNPSEKEIEEFSTGGLNELFDEWADTVKSLSRQASVCVEDMLFEEDDVRLAILRDTEKEETARKTKWESCKSGHAQYREFHGLGDKHQITKWYDDAYKLPDHYYQATNGLTQRVLDFIDICHLKNLLRGFDDRYYSRNLELSQNVYRIEDSAKNGVVGCLMPNGMPFSTTLGRKISGVEAMGLQAMSSADLDLVHQTQNNLQDMAGNAMTSTVVGAVMLAGLIVFHKMLNRGNREVKKAPAEEPTLDGEWSLTKSLHDPFSYEKLSVEDAISLAGLTNRLCPCVETPSRIYQQCKVCKHTACTACGGNPEHDYVRIPRQIIESRRDPSSFVSLLSKSIPRKFSLSGNLAKVSLQDYNKHEEHSGCIDPKIWVETQDYVSNAMSSELCLRGISRKGSSWEATYDSSEARTELKISRTGVEWLIYVNASEMPSQSRLGLHFRKFPVFRMVPNLTSNDITKGQWQIWHPKEYSFKVEIDGYGTPIPTYRHSAGLVAHEHEYTTSEIVVTVEGNSEVARLYSGHYRAAPGCGQAFNSLYFRVGTEGLSNTNFFYIDQPKASGVPSDFSFIFTEDASRIKPGVYRRYDARMNSAWVPQVFIQEDNVQEISKDQALYDETHLITDGSWKDFSEISIHTTRQQPIEYRQLPNPVNTVSNLDFHQHAIVTCDVKLANKEISSLWPRDDWIPIDKSNAALFTRNFSWAIQHGFVHPDFCQSNENWHDMTMPAFSGCGRCFPLAPSKLWALNKKGKLAPYEEPEQAKIFEKFMKAVPEALTTSICINSEGLRVKLGMNPCTLIHRAAARLSGPGEIKTSWLLVTDDPMVKKPNLAQLTIRSSHDEPMATAPPNFQVCLRPEQLRALGWMKSQENGGKIFPKESISEQRSSSTSMRLWGKATQESPVEGGILAFEVGFGKTAVTVALVNSQQQHDAEWPQIHQDGCIPLKATLVYVPKQLTAQWKAEIKKFAGPSHFTIITIATMADIKKYTIGDLESADFIIFNMTICEKEPYRKRLACFSGMAEHDNNATPLAKSEWHKSILPSVRKSVDILRKDASKFQSYLDTTYATNAKDVKSHKSIPSTSKFSTQTGEKRTLEEMSTGKKLQQKTPLESCNHKDYRKSKFWVLEALSCSRVVVDEFTYAYQASPLFSTIKQTTSNARNKWMLSGTPALGGFADVKIVASLLGVDLGEDDVSMRGHVDKKHLLDMSMMEEFLSMRQNFSPALKERRHAYAQKFLDTYARKDIAEITAIAYSEHLQVVRLTPLEFAINLELAQKMVAQNFDPKYREHTDSNEAQYIKDAIADCQDGREAMVVRASEFKSNPGIITRESGTMVDDAEQMVNFIIKTRDDEYSSLKQAVAKDLEMACWLNRNIANQTAKIDIYPHWTKRVFERKVYGDFEAQDELKGLINAADAGYKADDSDLWYDAGTEDGKSRPPKPVGFCTKAPYQLMSQEVFELRNLTFRLTKLGENMVNLKRSLRFFKAVRDTQSISANNPKGLSCSGCDKNNLQPNELTILGRCGHVVCNSGCLEKTKFSGGSCPREGCDAASRSLQFVSGSNLVKTGHSNEKFLYGTKVDHMIRVLVSLPEDAKVLIFVQFQALMYTVKNALDSAGVTSTHLQSENKSEKALEAFQKDPNIKVLLLNIGDSSAAGSNLTVANHVFFVSPYLTKGLAAQQDYDSTMTQAIGRARRCGQEKRVHVYHFLSSKTIDVDIFEKRSAKILKHVNGFVSNAAPYKKFTEDRIALVEPIGDDTSEFASSAAAEIFSSNSEYV